MEGHYVRFDPDEYLKTFYSCEDGVSSRNELNTKLDFFFHAFADGKIKGRRLLDIGTGPTIHSVISATPHCDSILLSDFIPENREVLRKWYEGNLDHDFRNIFKYLVDKEGNGENAVDREKNLKRKIAGIVPIDVRQEGPLAPSWFPKFDVITSSLCLDAVASDLASYKTLASRVAAMLENGGHIILYGSTGESFYRLGSEKYYHMCVTEEFLKETWMSLGLSVVDWRYKPADILEEDSDYEGVYILVGQKM